MKERSQKRSAVGQIAKLTKPCQELSDLEGYRSHIPPGQGREMSGTAKEIGHSVVSGAAVRAGGLWYDCGSSCSAGSIGGGSHKHLVGHLGPDGLLCHLAPVKASGQGVSALFQHAPEELQS